MTRVVSFGGFHAELPDAPPPDALTQISERVWQVRIDGHTATFALIPTAYGIELWWQGQPYPVHVEPASIFALREHFKVKRQLLGEGRAVTAHMPGLVTQVYVEAGQTVYRGEGLMVLEAMKMENELRAPAAGVVAELKASVGDQVGKGQLLCSIQPQDSADSGTDDGADGATLQPDGG